MIYRFNPSNPHSFGAIIRLNGEIAPPGVMFADEERGVVYVLAVKDCEAEKQHEAEVGSARFRPGKHFLDPATHDLAITALTGHVEIGYPVLPEITFSP